MRKLIAIGTFLTAALTGCGAGDVSGPIQVRLLQPTAQHCHFNIAPATIQTLTSLNNLTGAMGQVYTSTEPLSDETITTGVGLTGVDVRYGKAGDTYHPLNYATLVATSLYWYTESGYNLFKNLDSSADMASIVSAGGGNLAATKIIHEVFYESKGERQTDNAAYLFIPGTTHNTMISYPTDKIQEMQLGLNPGVWVHEYTHFVFNWLAKQEIRRRGGASAPNYDYSYADTTAKKVWGSLDEGLADYFGFLFAQDPGYFQCSIEALYKDNPSLGARKNRDLQVRKDYASVSSRLSGSGFDIHEGGAVYAHAWWKMGQTVGHQAVGQSLINMMRRLGAGSCGSVVSGLSIKGTFGDVARCHEAAAGAISGTASAVYRDLGI